MKTDTMDFDTFFAVLRDLHIDGSAGGVRLPSVLGGGEIERFIPGNGIDCYLFNGWFINDFNLTLNISGRYFYLIYTTKGNCCFLHSGGYNSMLIDHCQTLLLGINPIPCAALFLSGNTDTRLFLIRLEVDVFSKRYSNCWQAFNRILEEVERSERYVNGIYTSHHNLSIHERLDRLVTSLKSRSPVRDMNLESICKNILAIQLDQLVKEIEHPKKFNRLNVREMQRIIEFVTTFKKNIDQPLNVQEIASTLGLTPNKLQQGFKSLYGLTVSDFIRDRRLERAELLLRTTGLNVSEVVYSIGLTSRSYFCKVFKRKYGCAPKAYKKLVFKV